ncbi:unnamed protein product [Urochloa humidicola]
MAASKSYGEKLVPSRTGVLKPWDVLSIWSLMDYVTRCCCFHERPWQDQRQAHRPTQLRAGCRGEPGVIVEQARLPAAMRGWPTPLSAILR